MIFAGLVTFLDPRKPDAGAAIRALAADGIRVVILTGDNSLVADRVCRDIGSGSSRGRWSSARRSMRSTTWPSGRSRSGRRSSPASHPSRRTGWSGRSGVAVNDAPSLHGADIGIFVANATEVAHGSANLILLKHDLRVLHDGVSVSRSGSRRAGDIPGASPALPFSSIAVSADQRSDAIANSSRTSVTPPIRLATDSAFSASSSVGTLPRR